MGTFHDGRHELHGITVVVDTVGDEIFVGRCDDLDDREIRLVGVDVHREGEKGRSKQDYLLRAARFGIWERFPRVVIPRHRVASVRPLGDL
jgi:hypothetical protein